jgi:hypothetical protein
MQINLNSLKEHPALFSFLSVATLLSLLCLLFKPIWESNDDVAMSMVAHGYGLAAYGSPNLIFSNVLWGYVVRALPSINGVLGYSLATMATLLVFGWATLYFLLRLGTGYLLSLLAVVLLILQPTLIPQFTVNAGLLTVAAVIGWQMHARLGGKGSLVAACLLAFVGYLIRDKEFLLVLGVALPLLPWRAIREQRQMQIALLLLIVAIASAAIFERWSYSGPDWRHFLQMDPNRAPLTDFVNYGAGEHLKQRPEILIRHHYSSNDVNLISNWFFIDPQISDPKSLNAMLTELGPLSMQEGSIQSGFDAIAALLDSWLLPLLLPGLLILLAMPRWPVALAWLLCLAAVFAMGVMGRPGILRAYIPLADLLVVAPLVVGKYRAKTRQWMVTLTIFVACAGNSYSIIPESLAYNQQSFQVLSDLHGLPAKSIVNWGESFPLEYAFPVLSGDFNSRKINLYGLDSFTYAPFSVASTEQKAGHGMLESLGTTAGIPIIATPERIEMLRIYCSEHLNGQLHEFTAYQTSSLTVQQVQCEADK